MIDMKTRKLGGDRLRGIKPKAVGLSEETMIEARPWQEGNPLPLVVRPLVEGLDLAVWLKDHRESLEGWLRDHGGVLFRGFRIDTVHAFDGVSQAFSTDLLEYKERSTPRTQIGEGRIYTSTEYPAHQSITFHNEFSYSLTWPLKILFCCVVAAEQGGETPIADGRRVYQRLDPALRARFEQKGVMYVRNYGGGIDLSWQEAFQTDDPAAVEEYCRHAPMDWEWLDGGRLRTRALRPATACHPVTGEMVWFNQAHLFHVSNLDPAVRNAMLAAFPEEDLPRNTYYGDGAPLETSALDEIRAAYADAAVAVPWEKGDVLVLDNMLTAHGRNPYVGQRTIAVAMMEPYHRPAA